MAEKFRRCTSPKDFLLQTIGEGRSAIERAYDWLIPIVSTQPGIINRLMGHASCFLLLRAYSVEGDKNKELLDLAAPLLSHVRSTLAAEFGKHHALLAMELLMQDIADENCDRRRCARKVLQETIGNAESEFQFDPDHCGWLLQMIRVNNYKDMVPLVMKYLVSITQALLLFEAYFTQY